MTGDKLIVFGDDGSESSDTAWRWINDQPWPGWRAEVLTAVRPEVRPVAEWAPTEEAVVWTPERPRVPSETSELASPTHLHADADPRVALCNRSDASLLVIGRGHIDRRFPRLLGSTAAWLVHNPPAPLVLVHEPGAVRRVLACVDGSDDGMLAVEQLLSLPVAHGAEITVLSVYDGWVESTNALERARKVFEEAGIDVSIEERSGRAVPAILEAAGDHASDLIAVGARGMSGWDWLRIGSTAAGVAHHAPCTVFIGGARRK